MAKNMPCCAHGRHAASALRHVHSVTLCVLVHMIACASGLDNSYPTAIEHACSLPGLLYVLGLCCTFGVLGSYLCSCCSGLGATFLMLRLGAALLLFFTSCVCL